jgi:hypothetical protein
MDHALRLCVPGKLVLLGEYAVLDGAPAVVLAVDRGVVVEGAPGGGGLHIETPDGDDRFVRPALAGTAGRWRGTGGSPSFGAWPILSPFTPRRRFRVAFAAPAAMSASSRRLAT